MFSLKTNLLSLAIIMASSLSTAAPAMADENDAAFDMNSFAQPVIPGVYSNGVAAGAGEQVSPQTVAQNYVPSPSRFTSNQRLNLAQATRTVLSNNGNQSLPATTLDSFVYRAGGQAEMIYGDEGVGGQKPPMSGMDESHTIGSGINSGGLTTGHQSAMPSAWCEYY